MLSVYRLGKKLCSLCIYFNADSIQHVLFEHSSGDIVRTQLCNRVIFKCPGVLGKGMKSMEMSVTTNSIVNAFNCNYGEE